MPKRTPVKGRTPTKGKAPAEKRTPVENRVGYIQPDWAGAWNCSSFTALAEHFEYLGNRPTKGPNHFELYISERTGERFVGISEDTYGVADIAGSDTPDLIEFTKTYRPEAQELGASKVPISYRGVKTLGRVHGRESLLVAGILTSPAIEARPFIMRTL